MSVFKTLQGRFSRIQRHRRWNRLMLVILVGVPLLLVTLGILAVFAQNRVLLATNNLNRVVINLTEKPFSAISVDDIGELDGALNELTTTLGSSRLLSYPVRPIAWLYPRWRASMQQLDITYELALAANDMLDGAQPAITLLIDDPTSEFATSITSGARLTELLQFSVANFNVADEHLTQAEHLIERVNQNDLSSAQIIDFYTLTDAHTQLQTLNTALSVSPQLIQVLAGVGNETSYLVLAQNNDEIRPSGGFIGSYGWMRVSNGRVTDFNYRASDENSPTRPSDEFAETFTIPEWWIRYNSPVVAAWDGSWHVDFSETAALAVGYYEAGDNLGAPIDAVIAIDITGFEILLEVIGDVVVEDYDVTVTDENFRDVVYDIRSTGFSVDAHKVFLGDVYQAIQRQWAELPADTLPTLAEALLMGLDQKHILLYFADEDAQLAIDTLGWGGDVRAQDNHDFLLVSDANITGNKSNNSIQRSINLDVTLLPTGSAQQSLAIQYDYLDSIAQDDPAVNPDYHGALVYVNRLQVFTPLSASITDSDFARLQSSSYHNLGQHIATLRVDYDSTERYQMHYTTDDVIQQNGSLHHYRLYIDQQAGARPQRVDVRIILPSDSELVHTVPQTDAIYETPQLTIDFVLQQTRGQWVEVIYRMP